MDVRNTGRLAVVVQERALLTLRETCFVDTAAPPPPFPDAAPGGEAPDSTAAVVLEDAAFMRAGNATFGGERAAPSSVRIDGTDASLFDDGRVAGVSARGTRSHRPLTAQLNTLFASEADAPFPALSAVCL